MHFERPWVIGAESGHHLRGSHKRPCFEKKKFFSISIYHYSISIYYRLYSENKRYPDSGYLSRFFKRFPVSGYLLENFDFFQFSWNLVTRYIFLRCFQIWQKFWTKLKPLWDIPLLNPMTMFLKIDKYQRKNQKK